MDEETKVYKSSLKYEFIAIIIGLLLPVIIVCYCLYISGYELGNRDVLNLLIIIILIIIVMGIYYSSTALSENKRYFELEGNELRYFIDEELKNTWSVKEVELDYRLIVRPKSSNKFYLIIIKEGVKDEIQCTHLEYFEFYNDLLELQGKERRINF